MGLLERIFGGEDRALRESEFAGLQYPGDAATLERTLEELLEQQDPSRRPEPLAGLVAPYGDYEYAGPVMAAAYAPLVGVETVPERVLLVASSSRVPFRGVAVGGWDGLETPIGEVPVDFDAVERAVDGEWARPVEAAFEPAAALELQLPFLRSVLPGVPCIPSLVGDADLETVVDYLDAFWEPGTLLVVGGNLSEGFDAETSEQYDEATLAAIRACEPEKIERGRTSARRPLQALAVLAERRELSLEVARRSNSAETAGAPDQVVGYAAVHAYGMSDAQ